jgi:hypothetical protein
MQTAWGAWVRYVIPAKTGPYKRFCHCVSENPETSDLRVFDILARPVMFVFLQNRPGRCTETNKTHE